MCIYTQWRRVWGITRAMGLGGWGRTAQIDIDNFLKESRPDTRLCTNTYIHTYKGKRGGEVQDQWWSTVRWKHKMMTQNYELVSDETPKPQTSKWSSSLSSPVSSLQGVNFLGRLWRLLGPRQEWMVRNSLCTILCQVGKGSLEPGGI